MTAGASRFDISDALRRLAAGQSLAVDEAEAAVAQILAGEASEATIAAFLTALHLKGETAEELAGAVQAVRHASLRHGLDVAAAGSMDTCGTGGDGSNSLNISTATAIVVAACGVPVVKHGNRSASGNSGSAEVLTELGVAIEPPVEVLRRSLDELGLVFLFAPRFHPGLRHAGPVRKQLPFRTIFNLVGPLANPLRPTYQLVGASGLKQARLLAGAFARLSVRRAVVVTGAGGLDEVSLAGPTEVLRVEGGQVHEETWSVADLGLPTVQLDALRVSGPAESAQRIQGLLAGRLGPDRDMVLANAAAALWVAREAGARTDLPRFVAEATEAIDSGRAAERLERWRTLGR